jgi:hypothetical protein
MVGEKSSPTQSTRKAIRHYRMNLKKILRSSGCRQREKYRAFTFEVDVSR